MPKYNNYTEFEKAVFAEVKKQVKSEAESIRQAKRAVLFPFSWFMAIHSGAKVYDNYESSLMSLNEMYYQSYIRSEYQQEFEQHKDNTQYIDSLIKRVAAKIIKQLEND